MKEILIITSYFPPESGAASNRIFHLAEGLQKHDYDVTVLTPLPNYPTGKVFENYRGKFRHSSIENQIKIHRLWIYASNSKNKLLRLIAMLLYSFSLVWFFVEFYPKESDCPIATIVSGIYLYVIFKIKKKTTYIECE